MSDTKLKTGDTLTTPEGIAYQINGWNLALKAFSVTITTLDGASTQTMIQSGDLAALEGTVTPGAKAEKAARKAGGKAKKGGAASAGQTASAGQWDGTFPEKFKEWNKSEQMEWMKQNMVVRPPATSVSPATAGDAVRQETETA